MRLPEVLYYNILTYLPDAMLVEMLRPPYHQEQIFCNALLCKRPTPRWSDRCSMLTRNFSFAFSCNMIIVVFISPLVLCNMFRCDNAVQTRKALRALWYCSSIMCRLWKQALLCNSFCDVKYDKWTKTKGQELRLKYSAV